MEAEQLTFAQGNDPAAPAEVTPLTIIRTETVLSRMPVHNLAKKGRVDIEIVRRNGEGQVQLRWVVSHSDRYGQPRQLAYKLDTLVVNRRIDELGRPLGKIIRMGSLKEICKELGMAESGKNTRDLRTAFLQNASSFITAQLSWRGADQVERRLEAGFTRYGVVFTGEKLPDGQRADGVYIVLNDPYWEVVNHAPVRPLNYDYLKQLAPAAQRFYEIVSFRIYAALKNGRALARLSYADYCAFSAQQRYLSHEQFRVQMYKVHKPHLDSGYLNGVRTEAASDGEGKPDWMMIYTPGPRAKAEYLTFSRKLGEAPREEEADARLQALVERGVAEAAARRLLSSVPETQPVADQIEWGDWLIGSAPGGKFANPPGLYVSLIRDNIAPPPGFETARRKRLRQAQAGLRAEEAQLRLRYEEHCEREAARHFAERERDPAVAARLAAHHDAYARQFSKLPRESVEELARRAAQSELARELALPSFTDFCRSGPHGLYGPDGASGH
jgi:hypothetical protein